MKLYLIGHDYKYAVEQMLLTLFPGEKPEYPQAAEPGNKIIVKLSKGEKFTTASCSLELDSRVYRGKAAMTIADSCGQIELDRDCQKIIKNSIYRAALSSGISHPAWGALTGVRPGKLLAGMINSGMNEKQALSAFIHEYDVSPQRAALCMDTTRQTLKAMSALKDGDVCLYVGIPFCPTRCAYCSFVSQSVEKSIKLIAPFLQALRQEISATARQIQTLGLRVVAVYMGGGTPTTLSPEQLDELCSWLEQAFDLSHVREYTVEAGRPDTITLDKLQVLRRHGVDRLSVNPQTMDDGVLQLIGRKHTAADIVYALDIVRQVGGFAVNMDLIAGLPGDNPEQFKYTLDKVLTLAPENITVHTLSLKKGSRITLEGSPIPTGQEVSDMLDIAGDRLRAYGYSPYYLYRQKFMSGGFENVGWAKDSYVNLYNICIMEEICSVVAMGGGGSTKLIKPGDGRNIRLVAPKYPLEYIESIEKTCSDKAKISEFYND